MKRMMAVCSVVALLVACGGGGSGSDAGPDTSGDARELETAQFVDDFIEAISADKALLMGEDLSGVWLSVSGISETIDSNCENDSEFSFRQERFINVLHVTDQGDALSVQSCGFSGYSWEMLIDANGRVTSEKEGEEELEGVLSNNNFIDFGSSRHSHERWEGCTAHYEGSIVKKMIKLSDELNARVGVLTSPDEGAVDLSCFLADLDTKEGEGVNGIGRSIVIYSDADTDEGGSYVLYVGETDPSAAGGEVTVNGKTVTILPTGEEPTKFVFD